MSDQNIALIRRCYAAFNDRDFDAASVLLHPDFVLDFSGSVGFERGVYEGEAGLRALFEPYWDAFETITLEPQRFIGSGEVIIAMVRARGRGRTSGVDVDAVGPHTWTFRNGEVIGFRLDQELGDALAAAGLEDE